MSSQIRNTPYKTSLVTRRFLIVVYKDWINLVYAQCGIVGKFRPRLIELTSFKPKLLIRFIMNKTC